ncbi:MAG: MoxR family ATPase [Planctomycetaceae bacterium]|jgi:MoxR-like ATPase|nr:MoxR family ATPase [Planctomycetaceae bacterium]MBT4723363.1 MoxR family ATPase [Planctomycetaceae bacterium]MBT4844115.1 MoxR family ATPase [Planctomycetaceae bacterium]MBT5126124.1 MoxR family ATPase [Planctomycetaceae bacterium]MBT5598058.1 MoxR family ATPase [Planctomycetaceae bacterium]
MTVNDLEQSVAQIRESCDTIRTAMARKIVGQSKVIDQMLVALLSEGHCLLVGVPGLAKTLMVQSLSSALSLTFSRIQFTPDLMPADITGTEIIQDDLSTGHRELEFMAGPLFANIVLADEINRTPPKTQAALLEGMQERQVTVGGRTHALPAPFFVLATQNPIEQEGTYPLPEAQLDRFMFQLQVDYPNEAEELLMVQRTTGTEHEEIDPVFGVEDLAAAVALVRSLPVADHVAQFAIGLARMTRGENNVSESIQRHVSWGAGPRASQYLVLGAKAHALMNGRVTVDFADVIAVAHCVLRHRIRLNYAAQAEGVSTDQIIDQLIEQGISQASQVSHSEQVAEIFESNNSRSS